jgi:hypothetical protein
MFGSRGWFTAGLSLLEEKTGKQMNRQMLTISTDVTFILDKMFIGLPCPPHAIPLDFAIIEAYLQFIELLKTGQRK